MYIFSFWMYPYCQSNYVKYWRDPINCIFVSVDYVLFPFSFFVSNILICFLFCYSPLLCHNIIIFMCIICSIPLVLSVLHKSHKNILKNISAITEPIQIQIQKAICTIMFNSCAVTQMDICIQKFRTLNFHNLWFILEHQLQLPLHMHGRALWWTTSGCSVCIQS